MSTERWAGDAAALQRSHIINAKYPVSGASGWLPHGYELCSHVLDRFRRLFADAGYEELGLPSAVPLEVLERQAGSIKSFLDRIYVLHGADGGTAPHALASTIEAQISTVMAQWLDEGRLPPFRVTSVRTVGRHEGHGMRPLWMERFVWPFFEAQAAFLDDADSDVDFMLHGPGRVCSAIGLPTVAVERLQAPDYGRVYADRRHEVVTLLPEGTSTTLTSVYELGTRFSDTFGIRSEGRALSMLNFGFSARLVLALLVHSHAEADKPVYHPSVAPVQVAVVPAVREGTDWANALAEALLAHGVRATVFDDHRGYAARVTRARAHGAPLFLTVRDEQADGGELLLGEDAGTGKPVAEHRLADLVTSELESLGRELVRTREQEHRSRVVDLTGFPTRADLDGVPAAARLPLCAADACVSAALAQDVLDVIGRPRGAYGVFGTPGGDGAAATRPCAHCGSATADSVLLGRKFRGEK
ncbi:His/Gly/Thr/Pro-type tRNA ligase C-terminal domain-containing protein [Kitasatospora sp. NPDC056138]|uniref:His/Gly/Thr/Pro-type tRNA ligase C-terminal domain-containing protein n=1 Tax=Kitasatospora sp. NPDC056138 TaxID=3345724 RepID=UPI0035E1FEA4